MTKPAPAFEFGQRSLLSMHGSFGKLAALARIRLVQGLGVLRGFPESVIAMRFLGFTAAAAIIGLLDAFHRLSFDLGPASVIFGLFLLATTILFTYFKDLRSDRALLVLLMLDMIGISLLVFFSGQPPSVLTPLYLITLLSAILLPRNMLSALAIFGLASYGLVVYAAATDLAPLTSGEVTQIALMTLVTGLALGQSWYSMYLVTEKEKQMLKLKDQFVFTTAHDLRAPFALIRILAEKYESGQPGTMEELREDMASIDENVSSATQLLDDLLLLAKGENVRVRRTAIALPDLLRHLIGHWRIAAQQKDVHIIYESKGASRNVLGDQQRVGYALDNLISNSIKYNKRGGMVRIRHEAREGFIDTMIEDTGCGISPEHLADVFTPYFRERKDARIPGTGLGLYSAKQFIEKVGGTIAVASTKQGTKFTVSLPLQK